MEVKAGSEQAGRGQSKGTAWLLPTPGVWEPTSLCYGGVVCRYIQTERWKTEILCLHFGCWRTGGPSCPLSTQDLGWHLHIIDGYLVSDKLNRSLQPLLYVTQRGVIVVESHHWLWFPQASPGKIKTFCYFLSQKPPCWIREDPALYSVKVQAVPQKTRPLPGCWAINMPLLHKRKMDLLILAIIAEKSAPRCQVQSPAVHLGHCYRQPLQKVRRELGLQQPPPGKS